MCRGKTAVTTQINSACLLVASCLLASLRSAVAAQRGALRRRRWGLSILPVALPLLGQQRPDSCDTCTPVHTSHRSARCRCRLAPASSSSPPWVTGLSEAEEL